MAHFVEEGEAHIQPAPDWDVAQWFNAEQPLELAGLRGRVVVLHAFQMLCPACVRLATPQAQQVHEQLAGPELVVIGLHTVFEHHAVMGEDALAAFVHEYRWRFPIMIDQPSSSGPVPRTMARYGWRGTPTTVLIDRTGHVRLNHFGHLDDLSLGAAIGHLLAEDASAPEARTPEAARSGTCTPLGRG